ncbi:protein JTB [Trachemys scripta elegans]|uniref:protein JTB n=1 Tax=Trachemys scripta elegans TaxID=31138 RepID=UPI0015524351|nr:protein JTB [Trachemys scripta elegans]
MLRGSVFRPGAEEAGNDAILGRSLGTQAHGMSPEIPPYKPHAAEVPPDWCWLPRRPRAARPHAALGSSHAEVTVIDASVDVGGAYRCPRQRAALAPWLGRALGRSRPLARSQDPPLVYYTGLFLIPCRLAGATASSEAKRSVSPLVATPCWQAEDFVVVLDCAPCTIFQAKTMPECSTTGFIEQINCAVSKKEEYRSCRSVVTEAHSFWKFEGAMICVAVVFALLVMCRQRVLDRKALEKVRKQIESI